jgi:hypothetical protein
LIMVFFSPDWQTSKGLQPRRLAGNLDTRRLDGVSPRRTFTGTGAHSCAAGAAQRSGNGRTEIKQPASR